METICELTKALEHHPINAPDMSGDYTHHLAGLNSEIGKISRLTSKSNTLPKADLDELGLSIGTSLLLLASIANTESIDRTATLPQALKEL